MSKFVLICCLFHVLVSTCLCGGGGGGGSGGGGGNGGGGKGGAGGNSPNSINAAVISKQFFKIKKVPSSSQTANIPAIIISSSSFPLVLKMLSASSNLDISQEHTNAEPQTFSSSSVDGTIVLNQFVKKPIVQNVREVIIPQRKIVQEIMPVKEFIKTIISQEENAATSAPAPTTPAASEAPATENDATDSSAESTTSDDY